MSNNLSNFGSLILLIVGDKIKLFILTSKVLTATTRHQRALYNYRWLWVWWLWWISVMFSRITMWRDLWRLCKWRPIMQRHTNMWCQQLFWGRVSVSNWPWLLLQIWLLWALLASSQSVIDKSFSRRLDCLLLTTLQPQVELWRSWKFERCEMHEK